MRSATIDRTETHLMYLDMYNDTYEEDFAIFSATSATAMTTPRITTTTSADLERMDSAGSADTYLPTLDGGGASTLPRSTSHGAIHHFAPPPSTTTSLATHSDPHPRLVSSTSLDESVHQLTLVGDQPRSRSSSDAASRRSPRQLLPRGDERTDNMAAGLPSPGARPGADVFFPDNNAANNGKKLMRTKPALPPRPAVLEQRKQTGTSERIVGTSGGGDHEESLRSKLNQRRNTREKR